MLNSVKRVVTPQMSRQRVRSWIRATLLIAAVLQATPSLARGDEMPKGTDYDAIRQLMQANRELIQQVHDLQARVKQLEAKVNETAPAAPAPGPSATAVAAPSSAAAPAPRPTAQEPLSYPPAPRVSLRMFGDVGYRVSDRKGGKNSFRIGTLDLLMTGSLSDRVSILGELLFIPLSDNSFEVNVERLLLQYKHNDYFTFAMGRYHSSIGYYNTAFHQGAWFETTILGPFMYAFGDRGGFLPLQEVGARINGQIPSGKLGLNYIAEVGNGAVHTLGKEPAQNRQDSNNGKSFNLALFARPNWIPGLQTGFSVYHDHLTFPGKINHSELISTVYVVYRDSKYEFLNEGMLVRHERSMNGSPGVFHTPGFYTQISRKFGDLRPYFRYAYVNAGVKEPIYGDPADGPVVGRRNGPTLGLRYDFTERAAVKLQYDRSGRRGEPSSNALGAQFSFAF